MTDYLKLLRRVPDDIILSVATREIVPSMASSCLCGWVIREAISKMANKDAETTAAVGLLASTFAPIDDEFHASWATIEADRLASLYGGRPADWDQIFYGICGEDALLIEVAFTNRVAEAASR